MSKYLNNIEEYILLILFPLMVIDVFVATVARYFNLFPMFWGEELARYIMIFLAYTGAGLAMKHGAHVSVSFLVDKIKSKEVRFGFDIFRISTILLFTSMIIIMITKIIFALSEMGQTSPALFIPIWIVYAAVPFGMLLVSIRAIQGFIEVVNDYRNNKEVL